MKWIVGIIGLIFINSCVSGKATEYLQQCHARIQNQEKRYCLSSLDELTTNLSGGRPLFYVGSNSTHDHFVFYDDRATKLSVGFKVPKGQFDIQNSIAFDQANYHLKEYPIYLNK